MKDKANSHRGKSLPSKTGGSAPSDVWSEITSCAEKWLKKETFLSDLLTRHILSAEGLECALGILLSVSFAGDLEERYRLKNIVTHIFESNLGLREAVSADLCAVRAGDPATNDLLTPFLFFKGFHALCIFRVTNSLWKQGRCELALYLQHRCTVVTGIDIHPGATIGRGILFDHGTGIVIGETAAVSDNVTMFHNVTLGGTGRGRGDRHPKIGEGVFIGAQATLLGNINIGDWSRIGAGSVVLESVPSWCLAVGVPAIITPLPKHNQWPDPRWIAASKQRPLAKETVENAGVQSG